MTSPAARFAATYAALTAAHGEFMAHVDRGAPDECWPWTGNLLTSGYGRYHSGGAVKRAHRVVYELAFGPIPTGAHLDHTCHTRDLTCDGGDGCLHRRCCNPTHLEPVTLVDNVMRGRSQAAQNVTKTHCKRGHEFTPENTRLTPDGRRRCMACSGLTGRGIGSAEAAKSHCPQGHPYDEKNTYIVRKPDGSFKGRTCRTCRRARSLAAYYRAKAPKRES